MAQTEQQSAPPGAKCANCGAPLAPDQRYCLACGTRRGEPRVPLAPSPETAQAAPPAKEGRPADVSPLAAVIGIALLGGMLLIGVLIGRGGSDDQAPAPIVQVGEASTTTASTPGSGSGSNGSSSSSSGVVSSEWPVGTDGFTIQLSTLPKSSATPESVEESKQSATDQGAQSVSVLDSDLYASLPPGNYVIYSGVYTSEGEAESALKGLGKNFQDASVVEVTGSTDSSSPSPSDSQTAPSLDQLTSPSGGVTEEEK